MALTESDIEYRLSGGSGNDDPNDSLGGAISSTTIEDATNNNLFDDVSGDEADSGDTEYRCFFVKNTHDTITWKNVKLWINSETTSSDDSLNIALDVNGKNSDAETMSSEDAIEDITLDDSSFNHPLTKDDGLDLGDLEPGDYIGIWVQRKVQSNAAAKAGNEGTFRTEGEYTE